MTMNSNQRDFKYENSRRYASPNAETFKVLVATVDNNETIDDMQDEAKSSWLGEESDRRNLSLTGIRVDQGTLMLDIAVPQSVAGQVIMPQPGDVIHCRINASGRAAMVQMSHGEYNPRKYAVDGYNVVPMWLSMPGDYGDLRSYKDHGMQFSAKPDKHDVTYLIKNKASFITKWVRSITGTRWRKTLYQDREVKPNTHVMRGDNVFDIDKENMAKLIVEEQGVFLMPEKIKQYQYPNPNNAPFRREERPEFKYRYRVHKFLKQRPPKFDPFRTGESAAIEPDEYKDFTLKTKYQFSYEPILDKKYKIKTTNPKRPEGFERELPAAEEFQIGLKGNNKLLIQDIQGDGEQILMTFKSQYDQGFTIVHDRDRGQVRIRDHIGQTILLEGDRERPRIIIHTSERQTIEMGGKKGKGQFMYFRNGPVHGEPDVDWGRKPGVEIDNVFNQEWLLVDSVPMLKDEEFTKRISSGLKSMLVGPGIYHRTVDDSKNEYEKRYSSYEIDGKLLEKSIQLWKTTQTSIVTQTTVNKGDHEWFAEGRTNGKVINLIKFKDDYMSLNRPEETTSFKLSPSGVEMDSDKDIQIRSKANLQIQAQKLDIIGNAVDVRQGPIALPKKDRGVWTL